MFRQTNYSCSRILIFFIFAMLGLPMQTWAGTIQIESVKMVIFHKSNQVEFTDAVHLTRDNFQLYSDRLVAYYNDSDLERAEAFGNVKLRQGKVRGTAEKAVLNQKSNTLTLTGNAVLEQDGNILEGEKIIHDLSLEKTHVFPAKGGRTHMTIESSDDGTGILPIGAPKEKSDASSNK